MHADHHLLSEWHDFHFSMEMGNLVFTLMYPMAIHNPTFMYMYLQYLVQYITWTCLQRLFSSGSYTYLWLSRRVDFGGLNYWSWTDDSLCGRDSEPDMFPSNSVILCANILNCSYHFQITIRNVCDFCFTSCTSYLMLLIYYCLKSLYY